jgi:flagellar biosynthesis/type III secretory pathway chaperone
MACQQKSEASFERAPAPPSEGQGKQAAEKPASTAPQFEDAATHGDIFSSAAAVPSAIDSLKKFVRTADMRFRVKNVASATLQIEDIVLRNGGFMVGSNLNTEIELRQTTPMSRDSALETTRYSMHSQLVLRVPYRMLDTTLRSIGRLSDFLDHRQVNAEDVGLQLLEQELARLREGQYQTELEQSAESKNAPKPERARDSRAAADQARIETLKVGDAIRFSTVTVDIYQLPQVRQVMVGNTDIPKPQTPLAARLNEALRAGGETILLVFFGILHLWGLILLGILGYFGWKFWQKRTFIQAREIQKS